MSYYFDEEYYIAAKLAQLKSVNEKSPYTGEMYTREGLDRAIQEAGFTAQEHYERHGRFEGLNPNPYFNEAEYLLGKLRQLQSTETQSNWTLAKLQDALEDANLTPLEHYERYGAFETDAEGNFINPSNDFNANYYYEQKLSLCRLDGETVNGKSGYNITLNDLTSAFEAAGLSPVNHYSQYGWYEASEHQTTLKWNVRWDDRVADDPSRELIGDIMIDFPLLNNDIAIMPGPDFTLARGTLLSGYIWGDDRNDSYTIQTGALLGGSIAGGGGNDIIRVNGKISGDIRGGHGNDSITLGDEARVAGIIAGGEGADSISLGETTQEVVIGLGETGAYRAPAGSAAFDASLCDVIKGIGGGTQLQLSGGWAAGGYLTNEWDYIAAVADNSAFYIRGLHNNDTGKFSTRYSDEFPSSPIYSTSDMIVFRDDWLLVYDADARAGVIAPQAVVLLGVTSMAGTLTDGGISLDWVYTISTSS